MAMSYTARHPIDSKFLIVGTARNVAKTIKGDVARIAKAVPSNNVAWLIIESDSSDRTLEMLSSLSQKISGFNYVTLSKLAPVMQDRVERISHCRNVYLREIKHNPQYRDIDFVVVADFDGLNQCITREAFLSCWTRDDWDVCTANQLECYYDIYALRHSLWCPVDCFKQLEFITTYRNPKNRDNLRRVIVYSKMITIPPASQWIEVDSAFGGMAIYRKNILNAVEYNHLDAHGVATCEHVALHLQIKKNGGRIFINPAFLNAVNTEHDRGIFCSMPIRAFNQIVRFFSRIKKSIAKRLPVWGTKG